MKFRALSIAALACSFAIPVATAQDPPYSNRYEGPAPPNYRAYEARPRYSIPDPIEPRYYYKSLPRRDPNPPPAPYSRRAEPAKPPEEPPKAVTFPPAIPEESARPTTAESTPLGPEPTFAAPAQGAALAPPPAPRIAETAPPVPRKPATVPTPGQKTTTAPAPRVAAAPAPAARVATTIAPRARTAAVPSMRTERFRLAARDLFESDHATLRGRMAKLDEIAAAIKAGEIGEVRVTAHTDTLGTASYNLKLTQRRAEAVRDYLVERGVPSERVKAVGSGASHPVVYCGDDGAEWELEALDKCLEPNRRIEVESVTFARAGSARS